MACSAIADRANSNIAAMLRPPEPLGSGGMDSCKPIPYLGSLNNTMSMRQKIKVAIAGVGNCASALVQGVEYYHDRQGPAVEGLMRHSIGGYRCGDIEFVAAFD